MRLVRYKIIARTGHVNTLQHMVTHCNTMHRIVARARRHVSTLQHTALRCNILHKIGARARHFRFHRIPLSTRSASTLQRTTTHYHTLQHTAIHCNTIQQRHITTSACSCSPASQTLPSHPSSCLGGGGSALSTTALRRHQRNSFCPPLEEGVFHFLDVALRREGAIKDGVQGRRGRRRKRRRRKRREQGQVTREWQRFSIRGVSRSSTFG